MKALQIMMMAGKGEPPSVTTLESIEYWSTGARLRGDLTELGGSKAEVRFHYGKTSGSLNLTTDWVEVEEDGEFYIDVSSLDKDTTYYFEAEVKDGNIGDEKNFKTPDTVAFTYRGSSVTYEIVKKTYNEGEVEESTEEWLDRNLGASRKATSSTDSQSYGDLFQWGRLSDNHQDRSSDTTSTLSDSDNPGHGNFIIDAPFPYDWRDPKNDNLWQGVNGTNNPCPSGWRIPTETELDNERKSWNDNNSAGAYASTLKWSVTGYRLVDGELDRGDAHGYYSSSTVSGNYFRGLTFSSTNSSTHNGFRARGYAVRCIKN